MQARFSMRWMATNSYEKFMENSEECKKNIHDYVTFYLQTHKIVEISKPKKEFKVSDSIEDFNILDFV